MVLFGASSQGNKASCESSCTYVLQRHLLLYRSVLFLEYGELFQNTTVNNKSSYKLATPDPNISSPWGIMTWGGEGEVVKIF